MTSPASTPKHASRQVLLALTGLTLLALLLRIVQLGFRSIWLDEAYSVVLARAGLQGIISGAAMDIHPPLFYIFLSGWLRVFGESEWALRSWSVVCGALLVPVVYFLVRSWVNRQAAWAAAALVAVSPYFMELSRSGRMAAQLALFSALSLFFFWRLLEKGDQASLAGYCAATLAACYTHYFAFLTLLAQHIYVFMGIRTLGLPRAVRKKWLLAQLFLLLGFSPWLPWFWDHVQKGGPSWRGPGAAWYEPMHAFYVFFVGTSCWTWWHKMWAVGGITAGLGLVGWQCRPRLEKCFRSMPPKSWGLLLIVLLVPVGAVWIYSMMKTNVFDNRYLSLPALAALILVAALWSAMPRRTAVWSAVLLGLGFALPLLNQYVVYGYYDNWREVAAHLNSRAQTQDIVAMYPPWNETPLEYYLRGRLPIQGIPGDYHPLTGRTENYFHIDPKSVHQLESIFATRERVWLLTVNEGETQRMLQEWFFREYAQLSEKRVGGIYLYELYKPKP
ncbi:glycosyltransferase family 39 protein [candidate division FCPU426 bacterium]|nr:glycosyltransferase family 39 protein [candidate division FCPU426 bacterium]